MTLKVDILQTFIKTAAVSGIGLVWVNFTVKAFKMAWHIISTSPEEFQEPLSDNKLVKIIMDAATLTRLDPGIGWIAKKVVKENFTADPSSNVMNYAKFMVFIPM